MTELTGGTVTAGSAALTPLRSRVGGALIAARFVSDQRGPAPKIAAPAPHHGCALPVTDPPAQPVAAGQLSSEGP